MHHYIHTDLEGVVGVESFDVTRGNEPKDQAMDQLAREVNAVIDGIVRVDPDPTIDVWDLHGSGGLRPGDIKRGEYHRDGDSFAPFSRTDVLYFVGQHAMAGTAFAPLRHTYNSTDIDYYKLNDTFIGEFGCRALVAGKHDVPVPFFAGDDKACLEAELFVPDIAAVKTKFGTGEEAACHRNTAEVLEEITATVTDSIEERSPLPLLTAFESPYTLEIRYSDAIPDEIRTRSTVRTVDDHTVVVTGSDLTDPSDPLYQLL